MERGDSAEFFNRTCSEQCLNRHLSVDESPSPTPQNDFIFKRPPEAPTFYPTKEEFEDPILYISTIRPLAEQFGICKIVPPEGSVFPFTLDVDNFKFATRVQYLCRIDAAAKNKAIFLGRVAKFWEMRGSPLHTPFVEHRILDLYSLQRIVASEGGFDRVNREERWKKVAERMNFKNIDDIAVLLKKCYREILHPYMTLVEAERGNHSSPKTPTQKKSAAPNMNTAEEEEVDNATKELKESKEQFNVQLHRSKRTKFAGIEPQASTSQQSEEMESQNSAIEQESGDQSKVKELEKLYSSTIRERSIKTYLKPETELKFPENVFKIPENVFKIPAAIANKTSTGSKTPDPVFKVPFPVSETRQSVLARKSNELKRLQFHGAGPRIATFSEPVYADCGKRKRESLGKECCKCQKSSIDEILLDCTECNDSYHLTCIVPVLSEIPRGKWHCSTCISKELQNAPVESLKPGFEDGKEQYNVKKFQCKADSFKKNFFGRMDGVPSKQMVENEFWKIMSQTALDCRIEYGADISGDHGTGFPTTESLKKCPPENRDLYNKFVNHPWNLNNLPVCDGSVFKYIDEPISGMKVPWMYVGMCFSTFCWHNEDHWSYSINYLHFGEVKTWYSVPGDHAEEFENAMKEIAPELFEVFPDILHQLSTMISPNVLMDKGIPVYRLDQDAGQFVITFPRAYHAGFNHGFNFAEAVNFAPPDWIEMGRRCIESYALSKRSCVFSQDELIFKIAVRLAADIRISAAAYHDLYSTVHTEFALREFFVGEWGADNRECVVHFETIPDDERQCEFCKTTVFMSGVSCQCDPNKLVCIKHYDKLCSVCKPKDHYLKIKHTSEEIFEVFQGILKVVSPYEIWVKEVRKVLRSNSSVHEQRGFIGVEYLKNLVKQAERNKYPNTKLLKQLIACVVEAETINDTSDRILSVIGQQRSNEDNKDVKDDDRPTFIEFMNFIETIENKDLVFFKDDGILKYFRDVTDWKFRVKTALDSNSSHSKEIETLRREGVRFSLNLPEIEKLERYVDRLRWREELVDLFEKPHELTKEILQGHRDKGLTLHFENDPKVAEGITKIDELVDQIDAWEEEAKNLISVSRTKPTPESLRQLLNQGEKIKARLPSKKVLEGILQTGLKWVDKVIAANSLKNGPYVCVYEDLLSQAHKINLELLLTDQILIQLDLVNMWKERLAATFLKSNALPLMEALAPRNDILRSSKRKRENYVSKNIIYGVKLSGDTDPGVVVAAFKRAEKLEFEQMLQLRLENARKKIDIDAKYCICRKSDAGFMVECSLCKEKFHGPCLQMGIESDLELADTKFLCSTCVRTKRPKLDILVELVQSMHMIKVRIPEGEALQRLTERAMNWQDRARKLLNTPEMSLALQRLYVPMPTIPRTPPRMQQPVNYERTASSTVTSGMLAQAASSSSSTSFVPMDHVYSTVSRKSIPPKKHMRKSPLIPRVLEEPPRMSEAGFKQLKELMIQGDLMEVFVEEATCIWKLLQTFKQLYYSIWDEGYEDYVRHEAEKAKLEAAELKIEKGLSAIERFFQDKPSPPAVKKRAVSETPTPAKKTAKVPRKNSTKKTNTPKPTKSKKPEPKQPKKKQKTSSAGVRPAKRAKNSKKVDDDDDENDDNSCEDDCAAEPCRRPTGTALHWVQCDGGCDLWFHLHCIGLNKEEIDADQDYVCEKCS